MAESRAPVKRVTLSEAVSRGLVDVGVAGAGENVTSRINLTIKSKISEPLSILIPAGCQFSPQAAGYQTMVAPTDTSIEVGGGSGTAVTVTVPTLCGSPFGHLTPPVQGGVVYLVPPTLSPILPIVNTVDQLANTFGPAAQSIGMPPKMFLDTIKQYACWWIYGNGGITTAPTTSDGSTVVVATPPTPPPFDKSTITNILAPQLSSRGATPEQINQISTTFWQGVDTTIKTLARSSPGAIQQIYESGISSAQANESTTQADEPNAAGRYTIEQRQADIWDQWDGKYDPKGEAGFIVGVRDDLLWAKEQLAQAQEGKETYWWLGPIYDQIFSDPITHAEDLIKRRNWMIAIYEEAYRWSRSQGNNNLVAHAYAQIKLGDWVDKSVEDFEQTFGAFYADLGMAISGDALGNIQKLIAEGVPLTAVKVATRAESAAGELAGAQPLKPRPTISVPHQVPHGPPVSAPGQSFLLATDEIVSKAQKIPKLPGVFDVICHGDATGFWLNVRGTWVKVGPKTIADAMQRTGYSGGPVRLISCRTGALTEGAAQQLADIIGQKVGAPTKTIWVNKAGKLLIHDGPGGSPGQWKVFYPTLPATPGR